MDRFNIDFVCLFGKTTTEKAKFVLAGDYNINLLKHDVHGETENFVNNLYANFSMPVVCRPTRFTDRSVTLIDNTITNDFHEDCVAAVMIADISDHLPVFCVSKNSEADLTSQLKTGSANLTFRHITEEGLANMISECDNYEGGNVMISIIIMFQCLKLQNFTKKFIF